MVSSALACLARGWMDDRKVGVLGRREGREVTGA